MGLDCRARRHLRLEAVCAHGSSVNHEVGAGDFTDVLDKIREGKLAAAGAIVGAVMKTTKGQADAGRVREIILARAGVED